MFYCILLFHATVIIKSRNFSKLNCLLRIYLEITLHRTYNIHLEQGFLYWDKIQTNFPLSYEFFLAMSVIFLSSLLIQMFQNSREATIIYMQLSGIPQLFSFASCGIQVNVLIQSNGMLILHIHWFFSMCLKQNVQ